MKLTKSKQFLADAIHYSGKGWFEGAIYATQDKVDPNIGFWSKKPTKQSCLWKGDGWMGTANSIPFDKLSPNWHQTVLSREEYFSAYPVEPVADADGWIRWEGGECPVGDGVLIDVKKVDGSTEFAVHDPQDRIWGDTDHRKCITAYRLHKPSLDDLPVVDAEIAQTPPTKPTIEQLASDYRNKLDCANRKQQETDDAKAAADAALSELERAGDELGLVITIVTPDPVTAKFTGKFHSAKYGDRPSSLEMICDGCGKRFGSHVGFDCRP